MKNICWIIIAFLLSSGLYALGQETISPETLTSDEHVMGNGIENESTSFDELLNPPPPEGPPPVYGIHGGPPPPDRSQEIPPVERWMDFLRENDPEEFEHFQQLQAENPEEFHDELRKRLQRKRANYGRYRHEERQRVFDSMSHGKREQTMRKLRTEKTQRMYERKLLRNNPEIRELENKTKQLAKSYRKVEAAEEKEKIRADLANTLHKLFDLRSEARQTSIQQMKNRLTKLQEKLAERESKREAIIERRLQDLLEADNLTW